jgi:hypothetical protein
MSDYFPVLCRLAYVVLFATRNGLSIEKIGTYSALMAHIDSIADL